MSFLEIFLLFNLRTTLLHWLHLPMLTCFNFASTFKLNHILLSEICQWWHSGSVLAHQSVRLRSILIELYPVDRVIHRKY